MAISAKDVMRLRKMTGAGMMSCKKALKEADGDFEKAKEILRKKGQKISLSRADRDANEGAVFVRVTEDGTKAIMFSLGCETDFVARGADFLGVGNSIADLALANLPSDLAALQALDLNGRTVAATLVDAMGRIGEKIQIGSYILLEGDTVIPYIHPGARVGVVVAFDGVEGADLSVLGKDVAMQIAAMKPIAVGEADVPADVKARELRLGREQAEQEGKPEKIWDRIAQGKLKRFMKDYTLLNQAFVKDTSKTVGKYIKEHGKSLSVKAFKRMQLGA